MTTGSGSLWERFEHDPRDPAYAVMRASDRDRAVVHDALAEAYAEGRIDRDELEERTTEVDRAKTYADLVPPLHDLTVDAAVPAVTVSPRPDLQRQAEGYFKEKRAEAIMGFLIPNLICWAIWFFLGGGGFLWPVFVLIPTGGNLVRVLSSRQSIVDGRVEKLQRRQAKALEPPTSKSQDGAILSESQEKPEEA